MSDQYPKTITPDFVGPPQKSPFDDFDEKKRAEWDKALAIADGVKMYRQAGGMGAAANWKSYAEQLHARGGLPEDVALNLGRYRMWKQGVPVVPTEQTQKLGESQIAGRGAAFAAATPEQRAKMMDEDRAQNYISHQDYFSDLVQKKKELKNNIDGVETKKPETEVAEAE